MFSISGKKQLFYVSVGLLSLLQFAECDKLRLMGPTRCSGRVEVFHSDSWGTVCDDHWTLANAEVLCRELNCGTALESKKSAFFGEGKEHIWLDDVQCVGTESSILKCRHRTIGENNCGHSEDIGVVCSDHVRLVNGTSRCNGRVEINRDGQWKKVCSSDWTKEAAEVFCQEIHCGTPAVVSEELNFGQGHGPVGIKTNCFGNESSLTGCTLQEVKDNCIDATAFCTNSKPIQLVNGTNRCSGRVELYHDGQWGTVCDDRWGMQEASVACREMNCGSALSVTYKAFFGRGHDMVWLDDTDCTGHEKSLSECSHRGFGEHDCDHSEDAGVICSEFIRLLNGTNRCTGRLEIFHNDRWGKVCDDNWSQEEAQIVCKELRCGSPTKSQDIYSSGSDRSSGFTATCVGNVSSISQCRLQEAQGRCAGVSLSCEGSPPLRLVNGTDRCSGRVEIFHEGSWGTVCDDEWDIKDAQVVCRAMDCGTAQMVKLSAYFGQGNGDIWLDDVACVGNESSLIHCPRPSFGENNCGHSEDASVVCSANIRLINGSDQCSGRVEVYNDGHWGSVYNINWGMTEAAVVCREMNCGDPVKVSGSFGKGDILRGYKISCTGRETSLSRCTLREYFKTRGEDIEEASVQCSGNVKLTKGDNKCMGRVEYYNKGQWGTVCGEFWDLSDASVVCRQLNCGKIHKITTMDEYGVHSGNIWIEQIGCSGSESSLAECTQLPLTDRTCNASSVAGVVCSEGLAIRLANSNTECTGRVEARQGESWHTVCDTDWNLSKVQSVCELLECGQAVSAPGGAHYGQGTGSVVAATDACFTNATTLKECSSKGFPAASCGHDHDAGAICAAHIRLADGSSPCSGRVEILYRGQWGTVCDDEWQMSDADVVCAQLDCGHAVSAPSSAHFGRGSGPIWLDNVDCKGDETALSHCSHPDFGENNCGHGEDAGAICLGALKKPQLTVSPSTEVNWGARVEFTCTVVTEQLGGTFILKKTEGTLKMERYTESEAVNFIFPKVDFSHRGSYFCEYQKKVSSQVIYFPQGNVAELSVTVKLGMPSISLTSPHAMVIYSPDKISVSHGKSFSITCSIHSNFANGFFNLMKANNTVTDVKPAFGHSIFYLAYFEFPAIEFKDEGVYKCVYGVNISSVSFTSTPSKTLEITVVAPSSSSIVPGLLGGLVILLLLVIIGYIMWRRRWQLSGPMVQFSNRLGGAIRPGTEDRSNGALDGRDRITHVNQPKQSHTEKIADVDSDNSVERDPEDLAGRVCYELEPLVLS